MKNLIFVMSLLFLLASMSPTASAQGASADKKSDKAKQKQMKQRGEKESDAMIEHAEEEHEAAMERAEEARESAEATHGDVARGSDKAQEMRARRDERKEIKEDYREGREPGPDVVESDPQDEAEKKSGKKPWWKFWSD